MKLDRNGLIVVAILVLGAVGFWLWGGQPSSDPVAAGQVEGQPIVSVKLPDELVGAEIMGKRAFDAKCSACHGDNAAGKDGFGPPLVHKIYEPSHHADGAFLLAPERGVQSHHWNFGNMPPIEGLTRADVTNIIAYVRRLQRENGIN